MSELPRLVQALLRPEAYPHRPQQIELVQTQISLVFIAGDFVYKIKKPVDFGFLDYTSLEKRRFFCQQEVLLNRRLCPDVYLDVVKVLEQNGTILVEGEGEAIEYAVKMLRLPPDRTMDRLLEAGQVSQEMVRRVAERLAQFHARAETNDKISSYGDLEMIRGNCQENFVQTEGYIDLCLSRKTYESLKYYSYLFLELNRPLLQKRMDEGRIRDCHGDVHSAHVCFTNGICIFDCIEFNERFRYADVASEVAFLAMDIDFHGHPELSQHLVDTYVASSGDRDLLLLLNFYKGYRAYVRGKVQSFKLDDPMISETEKKRALETAQKYFDLAYSYIDIQRPALFITTGLIGTGKSTLAQALAERLDIPAISSDIVRKSLAGIPITEHRFEEVRRGIYSGDFSKRTYDELFKQAGERLSEGRSVIIDAAFGRAEDRLKAMGLAKEKEADFWALECVCADETIKERLDRRMREESASDGRLEIFDDLKREYEKVTEVPDSKHIIIYTSVSREEMIKQVFAKMKKE